MGVALAALLLRTHKGGRDSGRSNGPFSPARAPSQRFGWRPSYKSAWKMDRFCVRARAPTPVRRRGVQAQGDTHTVPGSSKRQSNGTVMRAPTSTPRQCRGRPSSKSVHNCPKAAAPKRDEGWGDAKGVMDVPLSSHVRVVHPRGTSRCGGDSSNSPDVGFGDNVDVGGWSSHNRCGSC